MDYQTEEQQVEALKKWWDENGTSLVIGAALGIGAILGYNFWQNSVQEKREAASNAYQLMVADSTNAETKVSVEQGEKVIKQYADTNYAILSAFQLAKENVEKNQLDAAAENLQFALKNASTEEFKHIARTRLARILITQEKLDDAWKLISNVESGSYKSSYEMLKGDIHRLKGDMEKAESAYRAAADHEVEGVQQHPNLQYKLDETAKPMDEINVDA